MFSFVLSPQSKETVYNSSQTGTYQKYRPINLSGEFICRARTGRSILYKPRFNI